MALTPPPSVVVLYELPNLVQATVIARPSKQIKSPYVADIIVAETGQISLAHTPALGCCGLSDKDATILVGKSANSDAKCEYVVYCSIIKTSGIIVGIHPKLAEYIVENALNKQCMPMLSNVQYYEREKTVVQGDLKSRFDFAGIDETGRPFIMEVKSVPLCTPTSFEPQQNIAYFPDGYRKKKGDVVSPRALKHIRELEAIKLAADSKGENQRCIMCYVIQRGDAENFQIAKTDPEYKSAVEQAQTNGVEIILLCVNWTIDGIAQFAWCRPYSAI